MEALRRLAGHRASYRRSGALTATTLIVAGPDLPIGPDAVEIAGGMTIAFDVVTIGRTVLEFHGRAGCRCGCGQSRTPEIADIGMMQARLAICTFGEPDPVTLAGHAPGDHEASLEGTIRIVP
jgi:hypothetical protein